MNTLTRILIAALAVLLVLGGCAKEPAALTDEEILQKVEPYLEGAVYQDPAAYPSLDDFLKANLGLDTQQVESVTLYMGAPNQITTFFLMLTKAEGADDQTILDALEQKMQAQAETAKMGYMQGSYAYTVLHKGDRFFAVMHQDPEQYEELVALIDTF